MRWRFPLVSLVVTPLALLAALIPFAPLLWLAHWLLAGLMAFLAGWPACPSRCGSSRRRPPGRSSSPCIGCLWLLLPRGVPARWVGAVLLLPLLLTAPPRPAPGELRVTVLDVGQGLAVHVQTASARPALRQPDRSSPPTADSGERIILPYLRALGVQRLDGSSSPIRTMDHAGGAASVLEALPVAWLTSSLPDDDPLRAAPVPQRRCIGGQKLGVGRRALRVLHPRPSDYEQASAQEQRPELRARRSRRPGARCC